MNTTPIGKKFVAGAIGAAIAGMAAPPLLFLGTGIAQAVPDVTERTATTITTQRPGHVAIQVKPPHVSPPLVWGPFSSPLYILGG
ncbi:MAG: hypothetical protein QOG75_5587 [Mycobacterium sp.]|jgi:hypothetical protein|nr:hypothetical protein [Mycobacterium sp.]